MPRTSRIADGEPLLPAFRMEAEALHAEGQPFQYFSAKRRAEGWIETCRRAQTRLVPQDWNLWNDGLPVTSPRRFRWRENCCASFSRETLFQWTAAAGDIVDALK